MISALGGRIVSLTDLPAGQEITGVSWRRNGFFPPRSGWNWPNGFLPARCCPHPAVVSRSDSSINSPAKTVGLPGHHGSENFPAAAGPAAGLRIEVQLKNDGAVSRRPG